ncbi:hypothetical protein SE17_32115 [Kouleothrix aurantiaca]|uniref:Uncharacterized protein n=1 Tax=Kouleothrix aurantiaca TaxID=186479 RepID=A0A0P9DAC5_9CHLR|nr:hypothetical protein SE17_32115 [Kouleothrix aurantiaca]
MAQVQTQRAARVISALQIAIIVLVVITAFVHLQRGIGMLAGGGPGGFAGRPRLGNGQGGPPPGGFQANGQNGTVPAGGFQGGGRGLGLGFAIMRMLPIPLPYLFLLSGIGYLVLVGALNLPALSAYRSAIRWLLIAFAAVTIIMYFLISGFRFNLVGYLDKAVEVALIVLLLIDGQRAVAKTSPPATDPGASA